MSSRGPRKSRRRSQAPPRRQLEPENTPLPAPLPGLFSEPEGGDTSAAPAGTAPRGTALRAWLLLLFSVALGAATFISIGSLRERTARLPPPPAVPASPRLPRAPGAPAAARPTPPPPAPETPRQAAEAPRAPAGAPIAVQPPSVPSRPRARSARRLHTDAAPPRPEGLAPVPVLTREMLRETMLRAEGALSECVREGWNTDITIGITVSPDGHVARAEVEGPFGKTGTGRCMEREVRKLRFPATTTGRSTELFWPYHLPSDGSD